MKPVTKEELQVIKVQIRLIPGIFWTIHPWCAAHYKDTGYVCTLQPNHEGPHIPMYSSSAYPECYNFCPNTEPWYDE